MITFSKVNPTLYNLSDLEDLGQKLQSVGSRALLVTPVARDLRESVQLVKDTLIKNSITFIDSDISESNLNINNLDEVIERSNSFNIQLVISIGGISQRSAGRYISQELHLPYFEFLTEIDNSLLFNPDLAIPNRVKDGVDIIHINPSRIDCLLTIENSQEERTRIQHQLSLISLIFDLTQLLSSSSDQYILDEAKSFIKRISFYILKDEYNTKEMFHMGIAAARICSLGESSIYSLSMYTWLLSIRYKINRYLIITKLLPWVLEESHPEVSSFIREKLSDFGVSGRLSDLGITLDQAFNIELDDHNAKIIDNAF